MRERGDCFESSFNFLFDRRLEGNAEDFTLVHGVVTNPQNGIRHVHAWIELDKFCLDVSNGRRLLTPKHIYYSVGEIILEETKRYTFSEAGKEILLHEHYGPWCSELDAIQTRAIEALAEETT